MCIFNKTARSKIFTLKFWSYKIGKDKPKTLNQTKNWWCDAFF